MPTLREQTDAKFATTREKNPEFAKHIDELLLSAEVFQAGSNAIEVGQTAPEFALPNPQGETVSLATLIASGPVVVTFHRGSWCPYCNLQMRAMHERLSDINKLGAQLAAISPEVPDDTLSSNEKKALPYPVLSDHNSRVAEKFGVAWNVPELILDHMRNDRKLDLVDINGGNGSVLPIPATFVLDHHGIVTWRFVDVDYRKRAEPDDIVAALRELM